MKKLWKVLLLVMMLGCSACSNNKGPKTTTITIPETLITFTNVDIEEQLVGFKEYATDAKIVGKDIVIEVTEEQRKNMIQMQDDFADSLIKKFESSNEQYKCTLNSDCSGLTLEYDENINIHLHATTLLGITTTQILKGVLVNNNPNWEYKVTVINCHSKNIVAECVLPKGSFFIGEEEWKASY